MEDNDGPPPGEVPPPSLLPYDQWTEEALRHVAIRALAHAAEQGLPGGHHFYITFRTNAPGVVVPPRLLAQYPQEMTVVLQHQFWDLTVDEEAGQFRVGLSFGGVASTLVVPFAAITAFADPQVRFGLRFRTPDVAAPAEAPEPEADAGEPAPETDAAADAPQIVSLDAFRRRSTPKD